LIDEGPHFKLVGMKFGLFSTAFLFVIFVACGNSGGNQTELTVNDGIENIIPSETILTQDNLKDAGFKIAKKYNVEGLTAANAAVFGFWRPDGSDAKEYEIRFYPSHEIAVQTGTYFADEVTGDNAILDKDESVWKEGIKDRRYFFAGPIGTHGSGGVKAKYGGYVIYGNIIMLCEGANSYHSIDRCKALLEEMGVSETEIYK
jgi:hypothetical protein